MGRSRGGVEEEEETSNRENDADADTPEPPLALLSHVFHVKNARLIGTVVLVFQPAEEGGGGAKKMIMDGALNNVEAIFGFHVDGNLPVGMVASRPGPIMASNGFFEATIHGEAGHATIPQHTTDPILAASKVIVSLQHLVSREADPLDPQVITVSKFQGGEAYNVVPDSVTIGGTFRAFSEESFEQLKRRIEEVIIAQAAVQRCSATVDFLTERYPFFPVTVNSESLHEYFVKIAGEMLGPGSVRDKKPVMGAEDFAFYRGAVPAAYFYSVGMRNGSQGQPITGHSPYFMINEEVLAYGAALHAALAGRYLTIARPDIDAKAVAHDEL
ncbi:hypothetical protein Taro_033586 [Colocasia esculenta]|uniref:Peptidase M20 dimerisation domain-containing protein n=1 Tax=Colocasia esculenta TaxID=4460 RepID=A0A843VU83_COLES|nr:hypothetical protein [Colocasia esculenta]